MDYKHIEASEEGGIGKIRLDGSFGREIDGAYVAAEIAYLSDVVKCKEIHMYINTVGGVVFDSLSVVSAMVRSNATIHTYNEGLCMSAGFHTFLCGDVLHAYNHSIFMYHEARYVGLKEADLTPKMKQSLEATNEAMSTLISERSGKTVDEAREMIKNETYFTARDFTKKVGLPIELSKATKAPKVTNSMSLEEVVAEFESFNNHLKIEEMSEEKNKDILAVMAKMEIPADVANPLEAINAKFDALTTAAANAEAKVSELNEKLEGYLENEAVAYVDSLIENNKLSADKKESAIANYKANPEFVKSVYDAMPMPKATETIKDTKLPKLNENEDGKMKVETFKDKDGNEVAKDYDWYQKNASEELRTMMYEDKARFDFLYEEYIGSVD